MGNPLDPVIRDCPPCKGCKEKFNACHDRCPRDARGEFGYHAWKAEVERIKKNRKDYLAKPFSKIM